MIRCAQGTLECAGTEGCLTAIGRVTLAPQCTSSIGQCLHRGYLLYWERDGGVDAAERHWLGHSGGMEDAGAAQVAQPPALSHTGHDGAVGLCVEERTARELRVRPHCFLVLYQYPAVAHCSVGST